MLQLNRRHPLFDESMELLCTLSRKETSLSLLTIDFGYATPDGVKRLIDKLKRRGVDLRVEPKTVRIGIQGWREAKRECEDYWRRVYG